MEDLNPLGYLSEIALVLIPIYRNHFGNEQAEEIEKLLSAQNISNSKLVLKHFLSKS